nr:reverse transcriptase domain-containing protein [Tanacetum cinerariifolium]
MIHHMYVDGGFSMEILYEHCFNQLRPEIKSQMVPATTSLLGFSGETTWLLGQLRLLVIIGDTNHSTRAWMNFMIVRSLSPYNVERGDCNNPQYGTDTYLMHLGDYIIGTIEGTLSDKGRIKLCSILKKNLDIFAWQPSDMTGVPRSVAEHWLNIREGYSPVRQKKKGQAPERAKSIQAENIEVYVDNLVVKSYTEAEMMRDIEETFRTLRKVNMKLNPKKCSFGLAKGMFLGYVVIPEGIKPYLDKTAVVLQLPSPWTIKESDFHWTVKAEQAFKQLKQHISELPLLVAPKPKEELIIYLFATYGAISVVLMIERGTVQTPIYFISHALQGSELNYSPMEKPVLSLVFIAKRLRRPRTSVKGQILVDFLIEMSGESPQATPTVETQQEPWTLFTDGSSCVGGSDARLILTNPKGIEFTYGLIFQFAASNNEAEYEELIVGLRIAARMGVKDVHVSVDSKLVANQVLGTYVAKEDNMVKPRTSVKGRILADFLIEMPGESPQATPAGIEFTYALRFQFAASNNEAEYEELIVGLRIAALMGVKDVHVSVDSKLVANQVLGTYVAKEDNMVKYLEIVKSLVSGFTEFSISQVPRSKNKKADTLSKIASTSFAHLSKQVLVEVLKDKSIKEKEVATVIEEDGPTWMTPIVDYLKEGTLLGHKKEAGKLRLKAGQYELMEEVFYRRSFLTPWLRCVGPLQAEYVMREIHKGSCSMHTGPRHTYRDWNAYVPYCSSRHANSKLKMTKYYNARVRGVTFKPGDFVYRGNDASHAVAGGKLGQFFRGRGTLPTLNDFTSRSQFMHGFQL